MVVVVAAEEEEEDEEEEEEEEMVFRGMVVTSVLGHIDDHLEAWGYVIKLFLVKFHDEKNGLQAD